MKYKIINIIFFAVLIVLVGIFINRTRESREIMSSKIDSLTETIENYEPLFNDMNRVRHKIIGLRPQIREDRELTKLCYSVVVLSKEYELDEDLLLSVGFVESSFRRYVESYVGCIGYFQINPKAHNINPSLLYDTYFNVKMACRILKDRMNAQPTLELALNSYNGWASHHNVYASKVMGHYRKLQKMKRKI